MFPPKPLSEEEFYKARREGKRTMKEIDPEFWRWYKKIHSIIFMLILVADFTFIAMLIVFVWWLL